MGDLSSCLHSIEYAPMYRVNYSLEFTKRPEVLAGNADFITQGGNGVLTFREPKVNDLVLVAFGSYCFYVLRQDRDQLLNRDYND
jgi:hypothetical protein